MVNEELASLEIESDVSSSGVLPFNAEKYMAHVEGFEMTDDQKVEFLQTLWSIMAAFVRLGFGVDSIQHFIPALREGALSEEAALSE